MVRSPTTIAQSQGGAWGRGGNAISHVATNISNKPFKMKMLLLYMFVNTRGQITDSSSLRANLYHMRTSIALAASQIGFHFNAISYTI